MSEPRRRQARRTEAGARRTEASSADREVRLTPPVATVIVAAIIGWAIVHARIAHPPDPGQKAWLWTVAVVGWGFVIAGLVAWARRPENRSGRLMVLCGFLFFFQSTLTSVLQPVPWTIAWFSQSLFVIPLFYLMLAFPRGRLVSNVDRWLLLMIAGSVLIEIAANLFFDPHANGCLPCPPRLNLLLIRSDPSLATTLFRILHTSVAVEALLLGARLVFRLWSSSRPARLVLGPLYIATTVWVFGHAFLRVSVLLNPGNPIWAFQIGANLLLDMIPFAYLYGVLRSEVRRARIADMLVELGQENTGRSDA